MSESVIRPAIRYFEENHGVRLQAITRAQATFVSWVTDILIYVVILNLFAEFASDHIQIESFWITLLIAVAFKILLVILGEIEHKVSHGVESRGYETLAIVATLLVLFVGKLAIIEIVNSVFDQVEMHGLLYESGMILLMILTSIVVWEVYDRLGKEVLPAGKGRDSAATGKKKK